MFEKIIKYLVFILSLLIVVSLFAIIYGIYIKTASKTSKNQIINKNVSLSLDINQKIDNIEVIDNNKLLIIIKDNNEISGLIYDINTQQVVQIIKK